MRLLVTFQLCHEKVLRHPLLYLSYFFKVYRAEYYDRLQAVRVNGDWARLDRFFLRGVSAVSEAAVMERADVVEDLGATASKPPRSSRLRRRRCTRPYMTWKDSYTGLRTSRCCAIVHAQFEQS